MISDSHHTALWVTVTKWHRKYQSPHSITCDRHQIALQAKVTEWHHEHQLPNCIPRDSHWRALWEAVTERCYETQWCQLLGYDDWALWQRFRPNDSTFGLNERIIGGPLPKAMHGTNTYLHAGMNAQRPHWRSRSLLGRCWRSINITPDGQHTRDAGCKWWCQISRLVHRSMHVSLESTNEQAHSWSYNPCQDVNQAPTVQIEPKYYCQSCFQGHHNDHWWAGPAEFTRNGESSSACAPERMVTMSGYCNAYKIKILMQWRWR